jgi:hypothetical protein
VDGGTDTNLCGLACRHRGQRPLLHDFLGKARMHDSGSYAQLRDHFRQFCSWEASASRYNPAPSADPVLAGFLRRAFGSDLHMCLSMPRLFLNCCFTGMCVLGCALLLGCGTTRSSDTSRTATEQLLISDAVDRAVQSVDVQPLAGQTVFLDDSRLGEVVDRNYLISTLRQHLLASGCQLRDKREEADFVVEARAGAVGTDRNDLLFGIPSMNVPQIPLVQPVPAAIPEIPFAKRRDQRGIAKIAVFAYHRETGTPVWQSGIAHQESSSNDVWILGAGPFQRGTIHRGTEFAGKALREDEEMEGELSPKRLPPVDLASGNIFMSPKKLVTAPAPVAVASKDMPVQASHEEPVPAAEDKDAKPISSVADPPQSTSQPMVGSMMPPAAAAVTPPQQSVYTAPAVPALPQPRFDAR